MKNDQEHWHISKSVPVMFILAVFMQTVAIVWGAAKLDTRVYSIEEWIKTNSNTQVILAENRQAILALDRRVTSLEKRR